MTPTETAESVKRLRELDAQKTRSESHFHDFETTVYNDAMQTINALVQLVGEMSEVLGDVWYSEFGESETCLEGGWIKPVLTKAKPIAELAKEEK